MSGQLRFSIQKVVSVKLRAERKKSDTGKHTQWSDHTGLGKTFVSKMSVQSKLKTQEPLSCVSTV